METVKSVARTPAQEELRVKYLKWVFENVSLIQMPLKSKELTIFLLDWILATKGYAVGRPKVLCISCIVFVAKLDNSISDSLMDFLQYSLDDPQLHSSDFIKMELEILQNMPENLAILQTPSSLFQLHAGDSLGQELGAQAFESFIFQLLNFYIEETQGMDLNMLLTYPYIVSFNPDTPLAVKLKRANEIFQTHNLDCFASEEDFESFRQLWAKYSLEG